MLTLDNSLIADSLMRVVHDAIPAIGCPVIAMDNNEIQFVTVMPGVAPAPERINGVTFTTVPAVLFTHVPTLRTDKTLRGGRSIAEGYADFIVVTPRNGFVNGASAIAAKVAALFPVPLMIDLVVDGHIVVDKPVVPMQGYDDSIYWRIPVRVTYRAYSGSSGVFPQIPNTGDEW